MFTCGYFDSATCVFMYMTTSLSQGRTPLMYACLKGQEKIVQILIDHGADPEVLDQVHSLLQLILYACVQVISSNYTREVMAVFIIRRL